MPAGERPTFDKIWSDFLKWLSENDFDLKKPIVLCAFNGFAFDHKLLVYHLKQYNIPLLHNIIFIDPQYEYWLKNNKFQTLDAAYR